MKYEKADEIVLEIAPELKKAGYKKRHYTWYKDTADLTIVFSIQRSMYGSDVWYYCFGVDIFDISGKHCRSMDGCQIRDRYDQKIGEAVLLPTDILKAVEIWENQYGTVSSAVCRFREKKIPRMTYGSAVQYLAVKAGIEGAESMSAFPALYDLCYNDINLFHWV